MANYIRDKDGKLAIFQKPNMLAAIWILTTIGARLFKTGLPHSILSVASMVTAFLWAMMELIYGTNYFRKGLGFIVLFCTIYAAVLITIH